MTIEGNGPYSSERSDSVGGGDGWSQKERMTACRGENEPVAPDLRQAKIVARKTDGYDTPKGWVQTTSFLSAAITFSYSDVRRKVGISRFVCHFDETAQSGRPDVQVAGQGLEYTIVRRTTVGTSSGRPMRHIISEVSLKRFLEAAKDSGNTRERRSRFIRSAGLIDGGVQVRSGKSPASRLTSAYS
jgi:hypothetical protein